MSEYWGEFGKQIKICDGSMKETDLKILRMYLCERMVPEYNLISLQNTINRITHQIYYQKLMKNATKHFLKWVAKQIKSDSDL